MKFQKREIPAGDNSGGVFLRLKDGESVVGVFRGEIYEFYQIWENGKPQVVGKEHEGAKSRFRLNFIAKGELKPKIFEFGLTVYNQLAEIQEDYKVEETIVKITRRGTGTDTVYIIIPAKEQLTAAQIKKLDAVELNILEHKQKNESVQGSRGNGLGFDSDGDIPF